MATDVVHRARQRHRRRERHATGRTAWLRAAVLGADDGIVSTAALLVGVAAGGGDRGAVLTAGMAGLVAGACSMAAGEYVSVSSQRDAELADLAKEAEELATEPEAERAELAAIYQARGLSPRLAAQVADELSARHDVLDVHAREELGLDPSNLASPLLASAASAASFAVGAALAVGAAAVAPGSSRAWVVVVVAVIALAALGAAGAAVGRVGSPLRPALRVVVGGGAAMGLTALVGSLVGAAVG